MAPLTAGFVSSSILIQSQNTPLREHPVTLPPSAKPIPNKDDFGC
jgi:hypothetical protein